MKCRESNTLIYGLLLKGQEYFSNGRIGLGPCPPSRRPALLQTDLAQPRGVREYEVDRAPFSPLSCTVEVPNQSGYPAQRVVVEYVALPGRAHMFSSPKKKTSLLLR